MPRSALSETQVEAFRDSLCRSATRLFAENGYRGVTMRKLATDLGCSPMTPYRYFENKAEIFEAVRSAAFASFSGALDEASAHALSPDGKLRALWRAYVHFAVEQPHAYRIMFGLERSERPGGEHTEHLRGFTLMHSAVADGIRAGLFTGDSQTLAHLFWSGVHGLVALHLSGMLSLGPGLEELVEEFIERELGDTTQLSDVTVTASVQR